MTPKITTILVVGMFFIASRLDAQTVVVAEDGYTYQRFNLKNKVCIADEFGNIIIPPDKEFKDINYVPNPDGSTYGYFEVTKGKKRGVYSIYGQEIVPPLSTSSLWQCYNYKIDGKKVGCALDASGDFVISPERGYEEVQFVKKDLYKGYYEVKKNGLTGVCDIHGNEVIQPLYKSLYFSRSEEIFICSVDGKHFTHTDISLLEDGTSCSKEERNKINSNLSIEDLYQKFCSIPDEDVWEKGAYYNKIILLDSTNTLGYKIRAAHEMGLHWERRNRPKQALSYYEKMLEIDPTSSVAMESIERAKALRRERRKEKFMNVLDNTVNTLATVGSVLTTVGTITGATNSTTTNTGSTVYENASAATQTSGTHDKDDALEKKQQKAKEEARLKPLFWRDRDVYSDYIQQLNLMRLYPERYDEQHRKRIQSTMKQIREKWEKKGYTITRSEWETWKPK